jgi:hypothetical protein
VVLRFLHLLCEGHNTKLQNYLRHQPVHPSTSIVPSSVSSIQHIHSG